MKEIKRREAGDKLGIEKDERGTGENVDPDKWPNVKLFLRVTTPPNTYNECLSGSAKFFLDPFI